jgi:RNA polymerase sporulation-specific sigma factor
MIARRFFLPGGDVDDLLQEATIGLIKAIRDFQPDLGLPFRPFASCVSPAR